MSVGQRKKFWVPMKNGTSDLQKVNLKDWGSISHGDSEVFFVSCLWQEEKTTSSRLKFVMFWDTLASILEFDTSSLIGTQKNILARLGVDKWFLDTVN